MDDGGGRVRGCVSCYRIMTQGSHYHGSGFLSLRCARLVIGWGLRADGDGRGEMCLVE